MGTSAQHLLPFGDQVVAYVCPPLRQHRVVFAERLEIPEPVTMQAPQFRAPKVPECFASLTTVPRYISRLSASIFA